MTIHNSFNSNNYIFLSLLLFKKKQKTSHLVRKKKEKEKEKKIRVIENKKQHILCEENILLSLMINYLDQSCDVGLIVTLLLSEIYPI